MSTPIDKAWIKDLFACMIPPPISLFSMVYYTQIAQVCKFTSSTINFIHAPNVWIHI